MKRQVFLPFGKLFCSSSYEYINYIRPESVCQCNVKRSTMLQTAHFRNKIPFKLPALSCLGQREFQRRKKKKKTVQTLLFQEREEPPVLSKLVFIFAGLIQSPQHLCAFRSFNKSGKMLFCDRRCEAKETAVKEPAAPPAQRLGLPSLGSHD